MQQHSLVKFAAACREGLASLGLRPRSMFAGFPVAACGPASELIGRAARERLGLEGHYVSGVGHPTLIEGQTHAWFEVEDQIIDVTHDQFAGVVLGAWVLPVAHEWYKKFHDIERLPGYCMPSGWPSYPHEGFRAIEAALDHAGIPRLGTD